jgi:hypothetical protein
VEQPSLSLSSLTGVTAIVQELVPAHVWLVNNDDFGSPNTVSRMIFIPFNMMLYVGLFADFGTKKREITRN